MPPSLYDETIAAQIIERLCNGETLVDICKTDGFPAVRTVSDWCKNHKEFKEDFDFAREIGYDVIASDCIRIADDGTQDFVIGEKGPAFNAEHVQRSKLRVETRLKLLAKWSKRYSERQTLEHTGEGGGPVRAVVNVRIGSSD
ncbi:hypothetical protein [Lysobacter sp. Hz 25]|uniref:terminase small subunit-like protein n=1 Tax=Lysobacter sp. Hz 25 TaxID=3383698 RepID=UPI0038D47055